LCEGLFLILPTTFILKRAGVILRGVLLLILVLLTSVYITIQLPVVQQALTSRIAIYLSQELKTEVKLGKIRFNLFNKLSLQELVVKDRHGDSLAVIGELQLQTSDFFFLHDSISIDKIELSKTRLFLSREDSNWKHQFILNYIAGGNSSQKNKKKSRFHLHLKEATIQDFYFTQIDAWNGQEVTGQIKKMHLLAEQLNLSDDLIQINSLELSDPTFSVANFPGNRKKPIKKEIADETWWQLDGKKISLLSFRIHNGQFKLDEDRLDRKNRFDPRHLEIYAVEASLSNSLMTGDTLQSQLEIAAREKGGLELRKLEGVIQLSPKQLSIQKLRLETPHSLVKESIRLTFKKISDFARFGEKVVIESNFNQSIIGSEDLAFFIPELKNWKKSIRFGGLLKGTLHDFNINQLSLGIGAGTFLQGRLSIRGLPFIDQSSFELNVSRSNILWEDIRMIIPNITKTNYKNLEAIRYARFNGKIAGGATHLQLDGTIQTRLGSIRTGVQATLSKREITQYSGRLQLNQFKLGEMIGLPSLKEVSLIGLVNGNGWGEVNSQAHFNGEIQSLKFKDVEYKNIRWDATLKNQLLRSSISIDHESLKINELVASVDWSGEFLHYSLAGTIEKANLQALQLTASPLLVKGQIAADVSGQTMNTLDGSIRLFNAIVLNGEEILPLDSLSITATPVKNGRRVEILSNEFQGWLEGQFDWATLPSVFQKVLHTHYPSQVESPQDFPSTSSFQFAVNTQYVEPFLQLFSSDLKGFNQLVLSGNFEGPTNSFSTSLLIPQASFQEYGVDSLVLKSRSDGKNIELDATAKSIKLNEAISLPPLAIKISGHNDSTVINLFSASEKRVEKINLNALVRTFREGIAIDFTSSDFTINGKSWALNEGGNLYLRKNNPAQGYLRLSEGEQEIIIKTLQKNQNETDQLLLSIQKINLNDISPYFLPDNRLEGLVSGDFIIKDPLGNLSISTDNFNSKLLRLDNDSIGEITSTLLYEKKTNTLRAKGNTLNQKEFLGFDLELFFNDSLLANNRINLQARTYPIQLLERFLGDLFSDITGYLTGDISILGDLNRPGVNGKGRLKDAGLRVNYTQCYYKIEDRDLELTTSRIDLDGMVLKDTVTGNPIYLTGGIDHESFYNLFYDLDISTRKPGTRGARENRPIQLLKTSAADNSLFYGDVKGTALLQLRGPESDMVMTLNVIASEKDSSHFTLPPGYSRESGIADFLVERKYGSEMAGEKRKGNGDNIVYDVEITANPLVEVKVQLDELTGDEIKGNGSGTFKIRSGTTEPLTLRGRFDIAAGNYLFTFQSFFKKPFEIKKGGTNYIEWTGDPYDANIKFEAQYKAERVSFSPLASTLNLTADASNARSDVYVVARLSGKLFKPTIDFYLDFPPNSIASSNPELGLLLKQLQQNTNELNRQVTYLIVFNSFAPNELGGALSVTGVNVSSISGMLLSVVSDQINKLFNNILKSDKYRINLNTSLYNRNLLSGNNTALSIGSNVNFSIGRSFFNNRFTISTGLGMDAPLGQNQTTSLQQSILLLPDVTMEWLVNPSGTIRVSFFYRTNADYLSASATATAARSRRTGGSLSYKKEFDKLGDLFRRKKGKNSNN
jgi:hypothetical protein